MEKATKNTHLNHLEDMVFLGHIDGTRDAVHFIQKLRDLLIGNTNRDLQTSVKWDGAPAIWMGPHPVDKEFFIAKKSLFNKMPLYYQSERAIKRSPDLSTELKQKFLLAYKLFKDVKFDKILQGDFLFDVVAMNNFYKMFGGVNWNEDGNICVHNRHIFEEQGCKFAPGEVAKDFSHESPLDINRGIIPFGYHGNLPSGVEIF
jgi:hypothetical protein